MDRRTFLSTAFVSTLLPNNVMAASSCSAGGQSLDDRLLAWLMLDGGPDFRHMIAPEYDSVYDSVGNAYWRHRNRAHEIANNNNAWQNKWQNDFFHHTNSAGVTFGILKEAGWLNSMYSAGNVALICNAVGSKSRNHSLSIRIMDQGNLDSGDGDFARSGWGGRLASVAGANSVALTSTPRQFCFGLHSSGDINLYDKSNLIALENSRNAGLYEYTSSNYKTDRRSQLERGLTSWYGGKRSTIPPSSPLFRVMESERKLREFGEKIDDVLALCPIPDEIRALYTANVLPNQPNRLVGRYSFGRQIRNLWDAIVVNKDLMMRTCSLDYGGWDSHANQKDGIEDNIRDIWGVDGGLDMLWRNLSAGDRANLVLVISGEFGRQIKDNGGNGTDHGKGNIMMVIGEQVNGGVYGDMFPASELAKLGQNTPDIDGLTEFDHVYGAVCDWVHPASSSVVFPYKASRDIESPGLLDNLFV